MDPFFEFKAASLAKFMIVLSVGTIFVCYFISVSQGNVPMWLPMISDCAVYAPEKYLFRAGMISTAVLLNIISMLMLCFKQTAQFKAGDQVEGDYSRFDKIAFFLSFVASLGLITLAACNEAEDDHIHSIGAIIFFFLFEAYMILETHRLWKNSIVTTTSLRIKTALTLFGAVALGLFTFMSKHWGEYHLEIAVAEWVGVLSILLYVGSFAIEFSDTLDVGAFLITPVTPPTYAKLPQEPLV
eukprot:TRINITY_DN1098_c0_g1_i1.p1 TRINITY_DN1098_c0_g1~~TRINITY_DN1098_c0_g1_i1.p1  ORF type:complete len:260 (-),score=103.74 TRINITY_DN1098_c0_g1_i1:105-830(-)